MRFALVITFLCASLSFSFAQVQIEITPNPVLEFDTSSSTDYVGHSLVINQSSQTKSFTWTRRVICNTGNWASAICDNFACYLPSVSSQGFTLQPGEQGRMDVHLYPSSENGSVEIELVIMEVNNPENTTTGVYKFGQCGVVGTNNIAQMEVRISPNPSNTYFEFPANELFDVVNIYSVEGVLQKTFEVKKTGQYLIDELPNSVYVVEFLDNQKNLLAIEKLMVAR